MRTSRIFALIAGLALALGSTTASAQTFTFQSVGFVTPAAINSSGTIAGVYCCSYYDGFDQPQPLTHGFSLQTKSTAQAFTVTEPSGNEDSFATGIALNGDVVGGFCPGDNGCASGNAMHGFWFSNGSHYTSQIDVPGAIATLASGINSAEEIVGMSCDTTSCALDYTNESQGFLLQHIGGTFTTISFPGALATAAAAINDSGDIVGMYSVCRAGTAPCVAIQQHGFLLSGGVYTTIDPPGSTETQLYGVNNSGEISGSFLTAHTNGSGFVYQNGVYTTVTYPGASSTQVRGLNNQGQIVGTARVGSGTVNFIGTPK